MAERTTRGAVKTTPLEELLLAHRSILAFSNSIATERENEGETVAAAAMRVVAGQPPKKFAEELLSRGSAKNALNALESEVEPIRKQLDDILLAKDIPEVSRLLAEEVKTRMMQCVVVPAMVLLKATEPTEKGSDAYNVVEGWFEDKPLAEWFNNKPFAKAALGGGTQQTLANVPETEKELEPIESQLWRMRSHSELSGVARKIHNDMVRFKSNLAPSPVAAEDNHDTASGAAKPTNAGTQSTRMPVEKAKPVADASMQSKITPFDAFKPANVGPQPIRAPVEVVKPTDVGGQPEKTSIVDAWTECMVGARTLESLKEVLRNSDAATRDSDTNAVRDALQKILIKSKHDPSIKAQIEFIDHTLYEISLEPMTITELKERRRLLNDYKLTVRDTPMESVIQKQGDIVQKMLELREATNREQPQQTSTKQPKPQQTATKPKGWADADTAASINAKLRQKSEPKTEVQKKPVPEKPAPKKQEHVADKNDGRCADRSSKSNAKRLLLR